MDAAVLAVDPLDASSNNRPLLSVNRPEREGRRANASWQPGSKPAEALIASERRSDQMGRYRTDVHEGWRHQKDGEDIQEKLQQPVNGSH